MTTTLAPRLTPLERLDVADVMHRGVVSCPVEAPLRLVARMMASYRIHCIVVRGSEERHGADDVWGIVSDFDVAGSLEELDERTAGTAAATPVVTVTPDESLARAAQLMTEYATAHLVVVDDAHQPIGVLSTLDLARAVA